MKKETQQLERRGLPGGPNEMFTYTTGVFSTEGFRMDSPDVNNYQNIIPSGSITMKERDGSPLRKGPIHGVDNLGYEQVMYPGFDYQFPGDVVTETLMAKMGGGLLDKTIKCGNCGWEWKAADGGSDVMDCHKCGGKGLVKAQGGTEVKYGTPESWEKSIRNIEHQIGNPNQWSIDSYRQLQKQINEYKFWRENTPEGKAVYDSHNETNEYVVPLPDHLKMYKPLNMLEEVTPNYKTGGEPPIAQVGTKTTYPWSPGSKSKGAGDFLTTFKNQPKKLDPKLQAALDKVKAKFPSIQPQPKDEVSTREVFTATNDNILNASNEAAKGDQKFAKQQRYEANVKANQAIAQRTAQRQFNALSKEEQERVLYEQYAREHGAITQAEEPDSKLSKFAQSLVFPMTALKDLYHNGEVRDDLIRSVLNNPTATENNPLDAVYLGTLGYIAAPYLSQAGSAITSAAAPYVTADAVVPYLGTTLTGVNLGNIATAGFATHGAMNIKPDVEKWVENPTWENAFAPIMDMAEMVPVAGSAAKTIGEGLNATKQGINKGVDLINKVPYGETAIPYAWKSRAANLGQIESQEMFDAIMQSGKLTEADKVLLAEYQYNSRPFTGRGISLGPIPDWQKAELLEKREALQKIIDKVSPKFQNNTVLTRRFNSNNPELFNSENGIIKIGDRPTSFSAGVGVSKYNNAADRIVLSGKNATGLESNFLKNPYEELAPETIQNLQQFTDVTNPQFTGKTKYFTNDAGEIVSKVEPLVENQGFVNNLGNTAIEKELIGSGFDLKQIGKVKNEFGGFDYIVKPTNVKQFKPVEMPSSINSSVDDVASNVNIDSKNAASNWNNATEQYLKKEYDIEIRKKGLSDLISEEEFIRQGTQQSVAPIENATDLAYRTVNPTRQSIIDQSKNYASWPQYRNEQTIDDIYKGFETGKAMDPIIVMEMPNGTQRIVSGNTRLNIAEQLGIKPSGITIKPNSNLKSVETPAFKSEIDWENWVKTNNKNWDAEDIKNINFNKQEYDVIEQQAKADGTWMKYEKKVLDEEKTLNNKRLFDEQEKQFNLKNAQEEEVRKSLYEADKAKIELEETNKLLDSKFQDYFDNASAQWKRNFESDPESKLEFLDVKGVNSKEIDNALESLFSNIKNREADLLAKYESVPVNKYTRPNESVYNTSIEDFPGTPEQFIQVNSKNFKEAYPEGWETVWRGGDVKPELNSKFTKDSDIIFTSKDEYGANVYNRSENPYATLKDGEIPEQGLTKLYAPATENKIVIDGQDSFMYNGEKIKEGRRGYSNLDAIDQTPITSVQEKNLNSFKDWMRKENPKVDLNDEITTDLFAQFLNSPQGKGIDRVEFKKIFDSTLDPIDVEIHNLHNRKQLKSMFGNNGNFDIWNNPNIYKTVVPGAIGLGTLGLMQEKEGGETITPADTTAPSPLIEYVVKKGDTLSKIAAANNTSVRSIMQNNESIADPNIISINQKINLVNKNVDTPKEEVYKDWNTIRDKKDKINKLSDEQKIVSFYNDKPEDTYLIVDKKNAVMKLYTGGNLTKSFEVGVGQNAGDAQTVTKVKDGKTDWSAGNKSTGAGIYTISNINPASAEYYNEPAFNLKNENGIEVATTIHGTPKSRRIKFNNGTVIDNRMSNGCINGKCEDLKELYGQLDLNTKVYILPEDKGNNFQIIDGKPALRVSAQNRQKYNTYVDQTGTTQKGQGSNQTTNTLVYKPITATLDEAKFKDDVFQWNDFNDEKEYANTTKPFVAALTANKKQVMKAAKISSDVYNELAKMSFGIYGTESNFGDTHSAVGNLARATNKFLDPKSSSSPDYKSKAGTYGADEETRSVGLTQLRWNYLNKDEKAALKEVGITSNKDFLDPKKAAIGTVTVLGVRYNQQLNDKQKQDVWKYLPTKWNNRANYSDRVKNNSSYLSFKQLDKKQEGGEFIIAQLGLEKKPVPSYKDFLASIKKDKVVDYKERPEQVVIESTKTVIPKTPKKLTKQQAKIVQKDLYEDPFKPEGITSGDKTVDFLYNNEWLMDVPILGGYIKDRAKEIATNSGGTPFVKNINQGIKTTEYTERDLGYTGNLSTDSKRSNSLLDQYFSEDALFPKSKYKPASDYLEFLPSYSVKGDLNKNPKLIAQLNDILQSSTSDSKYENFLKNKKPIYLNERTGLPDVLGLDLGGHKTGIGWDDKMNLPYLSISDAWDFEPSHYTKKWAKDNPWKDKETNKIEQDKAFMQSYLMHKAGNPFKIYDRFYFDPKTRQYIPDEQLGTYKKGGESKPGSLMQAYNRLPMKKKMGGAIANKKQFGGQLSSGNITMYRDYVKGIIGNEIEAVKNYDKLNRIYYNKAKDSGMTVANYIMTYIANNS